MTDVSASAVPPPTRAEDPAWSAALQRLLDEPQRVRVHYQPIVDLRTGAVRGHEALAWFTDAPGIPAAAWFAGAARLGRPGVLEAQVVAAGLLARAMLVRDRFVTLHLTPDALLSPEVTAALDGAPRLDAIVLALTDPVRPADAERVRTTLRCHHARGAALATGDDGAPVAPFGLRPSFLRLPGGRGPDAERVAACLEHAERIGAEVVACGVQDEDRLAALAGAGVPLAQGGALGHPGPALGEPDRAVMSRLRERARTAVRTRGIGPLVEAVPIVAAEPAAVRAAFGARPQLGHVIVLAPDGRAAGVADRAGSEGGGPAREALRVPASTTAAELVRLVVARPRDRRWDPVVVDDDAGRPQGLVPLERLLVALADA